MQKEYEVLIKEETPEGLITTDIVIPKVWPFDTKMYYSTVPANGRMVMILPLSAHPRCFEDFPLTTMINQSFEKHIKYLTVNSSRLKRFNPRYD